MSARAVTAEPPVRDQPASRGFEVSVVRARRLSPSFLRMTFTGPDLDEFAADGLDQRIKLVLPSACGDRVDAARFTDPNWYEAWRALPDDQRNPMRTYTVRAVRPLDREVDVDVVLHGVQPGTVTTRGCGLAQLIGCACVAAGPAVRWCAAARPGDSIVLIGPNALYDGPSAGIEWNPPADATCLLLAGDETAAPAICAIVEQLAPGTRAHAYIEVPTGHDVLDLRVPDGVELRWLPRHPGDGEAAPHGTLLAEAVRTTAGRLARARSAGVDPEDVDVDDAVLWDVPRESSAPDGLYSWIAGEAGMVRELRRHLVRDIGVDRRAVAFMGYWRAGRSEAG